MNSFCQRAERIKDLKASLSSEQLKAIAEVVRTAVPEGDYTMARHENESSFEEDVERTLEVLAREFWQE